MSVLFSVELGIKRHMGTEILYYKIVEGFNFRVTKLQISFENLKVDLKHSVVFLSVCLYSKEAKYDKSSWIHKFSDPMICSL